MISTVRLVIGLFSLIPVLDKWLRALNLAYIESRIQQKDVEFRNEMELAVKNFDARRIASELGKLLDD